MEGRRFVRSEQRPVSLGIMGKSGGNTPRRTAPLQQRARAAALGVASAPAPSPARHVHAARRLRRPGPPAAAPRSKGRNFAPPKADQQPSISQGFLARQFMALDRQASFGPVPSLSSLSSGGSRGTSLSGAGAPARRRCGGDTPELEQLSARMEALAADGGGRVDTPVHELRAYVAERVRVRSAERAWRVQQEGLEDPEAPGGAPSPVSSADSDEIERVVRLISCGRPLTPAAPHTPRLAASFERSSRPQRPVLPPSVPSFVRSQKNFHPGARSGVRTTKAGSTDMQGNEQEPMSYDLDNIKRPAFGRVRAGHRAGGLGQDDAELGGHFRLKSDAYDAFDVIDTDGSGTISHREFLALATRCGMEMDARQITAALEQMDSDGNGEVDRAEFTDWYVAFGRTDPWLKNLMLGGVMAARAAQVAVQCAAAARARARKREVLQAEQLRLSTEAQVADARRAHESDAAANEKATFEHIGRQNKGSVDLEALRAFGMIDTGFSYGAGIGSSMRELRGGDAQQAAALAPVEESAVEAFWSMGRKWSDPDKMLTPAVTRGKYGIPIHKHGSREAERERGVPLAERTSAHGPEELAEDLASAYCARKFKSWLKYSHGNMGRRGGGTQAASVANSDGTKFQPSMMDLMVAAAAAATAAEQGKKLHSGPAPTKKSMLHTLRNVSSPLPAVRAVQPHADAERDRQARHARARNPMFGAGAAAFGQRSVLKQPGLE